MNLQDKKILVTGGTGFLGSFVIKKLLARGVAKENITIPRSIDFDLRKLQDVKKIVEGQDLIIHLAAHVGGIGLNREKPGELFYDNLIMGVQLIEEARKAGIEKFIAVGTICAYPKFTPVPFKEEYLWKGYPEETNAPYGLAKKMLLVQSQSYRDQYDFNSIFLLPVNLYGPRDNFKEESSHVIPAIIKKIDDAKKKGRDYIEAWGDGSPTREFLYVEDAAEGIIKAAESYNKSEPVNLGSGMEISIKDLTKLIAELMDFKGEIRWDTSKPNGQPRRCLDTAKAKEYFDFVASTDFREGLKKTIEYYKIIEVNQNPSLKKNKMIEFFDNGADKYIKWKKRNWYYYEDLKKFFRFLIPENSSILEIGSGDGDLLAYLNPRSEKTLGVDFSEKMVAISNNRHSELDFKLMDAHDLKLESKFDYIIMNNLVGYLDDVEKAFKQLEKVTKPNSKIIISYYNYLWEPILKFGEFLHLRQKQPKKQNWLSLGDIENLLRLSDFEVIKKGERFLVPRNIPFISWFFNKYIAHLPIVRKLCLTNYVIARSISKEKDWKDKYSVSVLVPARNEKGNIEEAVKRIPKMGKHVEIIFVEGGSSDDTLEEIKRVHREYSQTHDIKYMVQDGKGKGDAVRKGFDVANGDILMILDADLTVPPEDLSKFYEAIASGKGEFINGTRLVYQMEAEAMRFLNLLGNKFFSLMFTWLLDQRFKDTLCGTKVLTKENYIKVKEGRKFFGDFDPFGDFDLIFGASKLNLKIIEVPIRYRERKYGSTNISRFKHGLILLRMCGFASKKIKFV